MARDHARINLDIWNDPDFRALPMPAQHLYLTLWTHPDLSYCGSIDWRPAKLSGLTAGWGRADVEYAADCLRARHFIVVDEDTEEALVRSWIRFDGLLKQPRMAISCINAYGGLGSQTIRAVVVYEMKKIRERNGDLSAWSDERVSRVLDEHPALSAKTLDVPEDPFGDDLTHGFTHSVTPPAEEADPWVKGSVCTPSTPAPAPATNSSSPSASRKTGAKRRKPETTIPDEWKPNTSHQEQADKAGVSLSDESFRFRNHALANDRRQRDWDAAFRTWLSKAKSYAAERPKPRADRSHLPEAWQ